MEGFAEHIAHVDMDAFFVEVERLRRPELRGKAVVVGGVGNRGVVASASYEARRRGVRSAMPILHARRLCPHAIVVPPDHRAYGVASKEVFVVLQGFTPYVEPLSVDEAFLDLSGLRFRYASPLEVAAAIRTTIRSEVGLPASVGLAASKLIAKMAGRDAKPDGVHLVPAGTETDYLHPMPVRALWGVGEATHARLEELGVSTIGDIAGMPRATLERRLGSSLGTHLWDLANARDDRPVGGAAGAKSISVEVTYPHDLVTAEALETELLRHADRLATRLRRHGVAARTIQLKVRFDDFTTLTRSLTAPEPVSTAHDLYAAGRTLLERAAVGGRPVRLLGLGGDGLVDAAEPRQLGLERDAWSGLEEAVGRVRDRFGDGAVGPARLRPGGLGSRAASQETADGYPEQR